MSFEGLVADGAAAYDAGAITDAEAAQIARMRSVLGSLPEGTAEQVAHDFFFCRFLRGYGHDEKAATRAFSDMLQYRAESGVDAVREELLAAGCPWPWDMDTFGELRRIVGERGYLHLHTHDLRGNVLTHGLVAPMLDGMRAAISAGLTDEFLRTCSYIDEWMLIKQHALCVERGHLVGEHMVADAGGVGMLSFGGGVLGLVKSMGKGSKHYAERLVHIDDVNNSRVAVFLLRPASRTRNLQIPSACCLLTRRWSVRTSLQVASDRPLRPEAHRLEAARERRGLRPDAPEADQRVRAARQDGRHVHRRALGVRRGVRACCPGGAPGGSGWRRGELTSALEGGPTRARATFITSLPPICGCASNEVGSTSYKLTRGHVTHAH